MYHNVLDWLEATALGRPESIAFADAATEITYRETVQKARSVGSVLAEQISTGEPVALYLEKSTTAICMTAALISTACTSAACTTPPKTAPT